MCPAGAKLKLDSDRNVDCAGNGVKALNTPSSYAKNLLAFQRDHLREQAVLNRHSVRIERLHWVAVALPPTPLLVLDYHQVNHCPVSHLFYAATTPRSLKSPRYSARFAASLFGAGIAARLRRQKLSSSARADAALMCRAVPP